MKYSVRLCMLFAVVGVLTSPCHAQDLLDRTWQFGRGDGSVIAQKIRLLGDGTIEGYHHPNEHRWGLENGVVVFYHQDGRPTCRFDDRRLENGSTVLKGRFLLAGGIIHVLREVH